jgi:hypothetical protein
MERRRKEKKRRSGERKKIQNKSGNIAASRGFVPDSL